MLNHGPIMPEPEGEKAVSEPSLSKEWCAQEIPEYKFGLDGKVLELSNDEIVQILDVFAKRALRTLNMQSLAKGLEFESYVYGDGTEENPGLINVVRDQSKWDLNAIRVESTNRKDPDSGMRRSLNRCTFNELAAMAKYTAYFVDYVREQGADLNVYMARAAGSAYVASQIEAGLSGRFIQEEMLFVSRDTLGGYLREMISRKIGEFTGGAEYLDKGGVVSYKALEMAMLRWFEERYYASQAVEVGGGKYCIKFRKCFVHRDENGNRAETIPLFDKDGFVAREVATFIRKRPYGAEEYIEKGILEMEDGSVRALSDEEIHALEAQINSSGRRESSFNREIALVYAIKSLMKQFASSGILDDLAALEEVNPDRRLKVCFVDEIADGSYDLLSAFALKELLSFDRDDFSEEDLKGEVNECCPDARWDLLERDIRELNESEIAGLERLINLQWSLREKANAVDTCICAGRARSSLTLRFDDHPSPKASWFMDRYGMDRTEAEKARDAISVIADFVPHSFMVDETRVKLLPHYGEVPICLERADIRISALLKGLLIYNAVLCRNV